MTGRARSREADPTFDEPGPCSRAVVRARRRESASARDGGPRERLAREGAAALSEAELLALILRTGARSRDATAIADALLARSGGLATLAALSAAELEARPGVGPARAASVLAAVELGRRVVSTPLERGRPIRSPADVQRHFAPRWKGTARESFHVLLLDGRHRLVSSEPVSVGTLTASLVHPREVFREAIRQAAAGLVLVHFHPSGDSSPSAEDRAVTERLVSAGRLLGIPVVDHVIVAEQGPFSFCEAGCLRAEGEIGETIPSDGRASDRRAMGSSGRPQ